MAPRARASTPPASPPLGPACPPLDAKPEDCGQDGRDAWRPAEGKGHAHDRGYPGPEPRWLDGHTVLSLQPGELEGQDYAHGDDQAARNVAEDGLVALQRVEDGAGSGLQQGEDEAETGDEQKRRPEQPSPVSRDRRGASSTGDRFSRRRRTSSTGTRAPVVGRTARRTR